MLNFHNVDLLLDVGANIGQFAQSIREAGYAANLVSFEPLMGPHAELLRVSQDDPQWQIAARSAIGAEDGEVEMQVAGNSFSSSVLTMLPEHIRAAPESARVGTETAPIATLDVAAADFLKAAQSPFLKIDTQGFEGQVLDGAARVLERASGVHLELSLLPLYDGQPLYDELMDRLYSAGFSLWGVWPGIHDPDNGRMLQFDATFFRS